MEVLSTINPAPKNGYLYRKVRLDKADMNVLDSAPTEIVRAPGVGKVTRVVACYMTVFADGLPFAFTTSVNIGYGAISIMSGNNVLGLDPGGSWRMGFALANGANYISNEAVEVFASGAVNDGGPNSFLDVEIYYETVPI